MNAERLPVSGPAAVLGPAEALAEGLAAAGADRAFGVPGGGPNLDVIAAMAAQNIEFVLAHSETGACIMASVYGYLTAKPAAAVVTRGPGAAAAANGAAQATLDRHPLILITDSVPTAVRRRVPHQRLDQQAMFGPLCKASIGLSAETGRDVLKQAIDQATIAPAGTVHIDFDASADPVPESTGGPSESRHRVSDPSPDGQSAVLQLIAEAERPVLIAGLGATTEPDIAQHLLTLGVPILTTYQAIGVVPTEHDRCAGLFTNGACERPLLDQADLVVAVGLDPVEPIPAAWEYRAPVVSITNIETADPYLPIAHETVGPMGPVLAQAAAAIGDDSAATGRGWAPTAGAEHRRSVRAALAAGGGTGGDRAGLTPIEVVEVASRLTPTSATVTVDAGAHFLAIMPLWPVAEPKQLLISNGLATMGYALPAAIAAALAKPEQPVLCLVGDGGLGMTLAELETVVRLDLPVTVVVFNDSELSLIKIKQTAAHGGDEVVAYRRTDFAAMARAAGMAAIRADDPQQLAAALDGGWDRPRLVDVAVNPEQYRHLITVTRG